MFSSKNTILTIGKESVWGTAVEPDGYLEIASFKGGLQYDTVESQILTGSRNSNGSIQVGKKGSMSISTELTSSNAGYFFKGILGDEVLTSLGSGEYKHSFTMTNSSTLPSFTFRKTEGAWTVKDCVGSVMNSLSLEVSPKAIISSTVEALYKSEVDKGIVVTADSATEKLEAVAHGLINTNKIKIFRVGTGTLPAPLNSDTVYFVVNKSADDFEVSLTSGGTAIALTTDGTGALKVYKQNTLTAPTQRPFIFNDGSIKLNGANLGTCKSASISFNNGLNSEDIRLGTGGQISSLTASGFELSGNLSLILDEDSVMIPDLINDNSDFSLELTLDTGITLGTGTYKMVLIIDNARFKNISWENDGDFLGLKCDFSALTSTPVEIDLHNNYATLY